MKINKRYINKNNAPETNENIEDEINQLNIQIQQN